jgi:hypothetical protein
MRAGARMRAEAGTKHNFSRQHLVAARHFTTLADQIEAATTAADATEPQRSNHRAYVTGAVVFSVAYLEASINELYLEAIDRNRTSLAGLADHQISILAELWAIGEPHHQALEKYQIALSVCGVQGFDRGGEPFQGTDSLIKIRNALIHYRPEWDDELRKHKKIRSRFSGRFPLNPLVPSSSLWFPHRCLGAGCARWSVEQAERFMTKFCQKLNIPSRLP